MRRLVWYVPYLFVFLKFSEGTIEIFDFLGRKVDSFETREFNDDFVPIEGFLTSATPQDACGPVAPPSFLTNFTMGKFLLINGTSACSFTSKIRNAERAGYDAAIIYDPSPMPFLYVHILPIPRIEINIEVVFVSYSDGLSLRENYVYNNSYKFNYRVEIKPTLPDITYYMYLFGAVIGICFFVMLLFLFCLCVKCIQERRRSRRNRLSHRQLKQIPTAKFTKGDPYITCAICLEDFNEGEKLRILPCSHAYHTKCIDPWLIHNRRNCPLCKRKITFGDSEDESDSDDSELTSPAENTPLLAATPSSRVGWGTFASELTEDGSGPSSLPEGNVRTALLHNYRLRVPSSPSHSDHQLSDEDSFFPASNRSINCSSATASPDMQAIVVIDESDENHAGC